MALTLRLTEENDQALRAIAAVTGLKLNTAVNLAVRDFAFNRKSEVRRGLQLLKKGNKTNESDSKFKRRR